METIHPKPSNHPEGSMLPLYDPITEDLKVSKGTPALIPTQQVIKRSLVGIKVSLSVLFAMMTATILALGFLYYSFQYEVRERQSLHVSHVTLSERTAAMQITLDEYKSEMAKLIERMAHASARESTAQNEIRREIEKRRFEILNLQKKLKMFEAREQTLEPISTESTLASAENGEPAVPSFQTAIPDKAVPTLQKSKRLIGPSPSEETASAGIGNERVLTINRKFNFVVINMGSEDSVEEGDQFDIVRHGTVIGTVEVEKLYDSFSAATIVKEEKNVPIQVGDAIRRAS